jgi:hypothetical protein
MTRPLEPREVERLLRDLPRARVPDPETMWEGIQSDLRAGGGRSRATGDGRRAAGISRLRRPVRSAWLAAAAVALAVVGGAAAGTWWAFAPPAEWAVVRLAGAPSVAGAPLVDTGTLAVGEWLETDAQSRAVLELGRIGSAQIGPGSRVRLERAGFTERRLTLARGSFHAAVSAPPRIFIVETPAVRATDLGCAYTLEVDGAGSSRLRVIAGSVELRQNGVTTIVPTGLVAEVEVGGRPGTPYSRELSSEARDALHRIDAGAADNGDLDLLLDAMYRPADHATYRRRSAITLWHVVQRVAPADRARVYDRLTALYPEPAGVAMEGILALDRHMLERWRKALHPSWADEAPKGLARLGRRLWEWTIR